MISDTSTWSRRPCNLSTTRSARGCHPCLRYALLPMCPGRTLKGWRRERDSNPRYGFPYTHFPGVRLQPLGHLSNRACALRRTHFPERRAPKARCAPSTTRPPLRPRLNVSAARALRNQSAPSLAERDGDLQAASARRVDFSQRIDASILSPKTAYQCGDGTNRNHRSHSRRRAGAAHGRARQGVSAARGQRPRAASDHAPRPTMRPCHYKCQSASSSGSPNSTFP